MKSLAAAGWYDTKSLVGTAIIPSWTTTAPGQKETGFFFLPAATAADLISMGRCSEMDIILDLWLSAVYNDQRVQGSFTGPVAYFRNGTGKSACIIFGAFAALGRL